MTNKEIEALKELGKILRAGEELIQTILLESGDGEQRVNEEACEQLMSYCQNETSIIDCELKNEVNIAGLVTRHLLELGIPTHLKGYQYLRTAIMVGIEDIEILESMSRCLYPTVAKQHNTTASKVERAMRHAIETSLNRNRLNKEIFYEIFGNTMSPDKGKHTNSEYIKGIVDYVRQNYKFA